MGLVLRTGEFTITAEKASLESHFLFRFKKVRKTHKNPIEKPVHDEHKCGYFIDIKSSRDSKYVHVQFTLITSGIG